MCMGQSFEVALIFTNIKLKLLCPQSGLGTARLTTNSHSRFPKPSFSVRGMVPLQELKESERRNPTEPNTRLIRNEIGNPGLAQCRIDDPKNDRRGHHQVTSRHPFPMRRKFTSFRSSPALPCEKPGGDTHHQKAGHGRNATAGTEGHDEASGSSKQQHTDHVHSPHHPVEFCCPASYGTAELDRPAHEGDGAGENMRIKADTIRCAEEVQISADQKSLPKVRWHVSLVGRYNNDSEEHDAQRDNTSCKCNGCTPEITRVVLAARFRHYPHICPYAIVIRRVVHWHHDC